MPLRGGPKGRFALADCPKHPNSRGFQIPAESASRWIIHVPPIRGKIESPLMNAAIPERRPGTEQVFGVIERVTFEQTILHRAGKDVIRLLFDQLG
jgi:hypothetical protein